MCFLVNFSNFLRTPILKNICERLLLRFLCKDWSIPCHLVNKLCSSCLEFFPIQNVHIDISIVKKLETILLRLNLTQNILSRFEFYSVPSIFFQVQEFPVIKPLQMPYCDQKLNEVLAESVK